MLSPRSPGPGEDAAAVAAIAPSITTPAFVLCERSIRRSLAEAARARREAGCKVLYAQKPLGHVDALRWMVGHVDGMAASSLFEARLSREVLGDRGTVSVTSPGLRPDEIEALGEICDHVVCNSLSQLDRFQGRIGGRASLGLRVNPGLSFVEDDRYNPCRPGSKLGVPLAHLARRAGDLPATLAGLHVHSNCDAVSFAPLLTTVRYLDRHLGALMSRLSWVNLGGGYLLRPGLDLGPLGEAVRLLASRHGVTVYIEPGAALVREAGFLVASVIDLFDGDRGPVAVLDTTVNHMPEVFEYQYEPEVLGHDPRGPHWYTLAGSTCLSMDVFGLYGFREPLSLGSRVIFPNAGAYTMVKAHMFNGVNLPDNYTLSADGSIHAGRRYTYQDFLARCGAR